MAEGASSMAATSSAPPASSTGPDPRGELSWLVFICDQGTTGPEPRQPRFLAGHRTFDRRRWGVVLHAGRSARPWRAGIGARSGRMERSRATGVSGAGVRAEDEE